MFLSNLGCEDSLHFSLQQIKVEEAAKGGFIVTLRLIFLQKEEEEKGFFL